MYIYIVHMLATLVTEAAFCAASPTEVKVTSFFYMLCFNEVRNIEMKLRLLKLLNMKYTSDMLHNWSQVSDVWYIYYIYILYLYIHLIIRLSEFYIST